MNADAFLDAIIHEPDDLGHRLVFADWLEDHGQSDRAEFIRLQIERSALHPADPRTRVCLRREQELLARHELYWASPIVHFAPRWLFHRGFIEEVSLSAEQFLAHGHELFRRAPIQRVALRHTMALPALLNQNPAARATLASLLPQVRVLDLNRDGLSESAGQGLMQLPSLPKLEGLLLSHTALSSASVAVLAESKVLASLRQLEFTGSIESLAILLHSPHLGRLEHLSLATTRQGDRIASVLIGSGVLGRLRSLSLGHTGLGPDGLEELVGSPQIGRLESLDLSFNTLGRTGLDILLAAERRGGVSLPRLDQLNLSRTDLRDEGVRRLASSLLAQLRGIDLSLNRITDVGGRALADGGSNSGLTSPARLGTLDLIYNDLGPNTRHVLRQRFGEDVCLFNR